jgi:pyrophosphatase PpaX
VEILMRPLLLLDLDGTLVDTLGFIIDCFRESVLPLVKQPPTKAEIVATFGPAEEECIRRLLVQYQEADLLNQPLTIEVISEAGRRFHALYHAGYSAGKVQPYPQMLEVVQQARQLGWATGIFTGKGRISAMATLEHLQLTSLFDAIISSDDVAHPKPAPDGVILAAERAGSSPAHSLFVGDNPADIKAGKAAGSKTAAAMWGAVFPEETLATKPDYVLETPAELLSLLLPYSS